MLADLIADASNEIRICMNIDGIYCDGRYKVRTVSFEMRMSHWVDAPIVERVEDGATVLDLSGDLWDLWSIREDDDALVLMMRKYPGLTNDVEVRVLPENDSFSIMGKNVTLEELISELKKFP